MTKNKRKNQRKKPKGLKITEVLSKKNPYPRQEDYPSVIHACNRGD
ncbi:hypothetical protein JT359_13430 [Candidatus Poribacteria bacterium]|nr:hypothetical protein [Candidatus Poribacteria bacterium]